MKERIAMIFITFLFVLFGGITNANQLDVLHRGIEQYASKTIGLKAPETKLNMPVHTSPFAFIKQMALNSKDLAGLKFKKGDWVINSSFLITHDTTINNDIFLIGNGQLIVRGCSLCVKGCIYSTQNSLFSIDSCTLIMPQEYVYQFGFLSIDSSKIEIKHSTLNSSNLPLGAGIGGSLDKTLTGGSLVFDSVHMDNSFVSFGIMGHNSKINVRHTNRAGEFVIMGDSASVHISHSDSIIVWVGFPRGSSGKLYGDSLNANKWINHFAYPDTTCKRINYSFVLDSLTGLRLGTMTMDSTNVDLYNIDGIFAGNIFEIPLNDTITGLVDYSKYSDFTAPLPGRTYHLVNSSVNAWNLYFNAGTQLSIKGSIFGECILSDSAKSTFTNVTCDGAAGHIGTSSDSLLVCFLTTLYTDAVMDGSSMSMMVLTSMSGNGHLIARNMATVVLYNTILANPIMIYDSATVLVSALYPSSPAYTNDSISIRGSANMVKGPSSHFNFEGYRIEYASANNTSTFFPITGKITIPVDNGELCKFSTYGLNSGTYVIRLWYFFSTFGTNDSFKFDNSIYLNRQNVAENTKRKRLLFFVSPGVFNKEISINYVIPNPVKIDLSVYNISGEKVATIDKGMKNAGEYTVKWNGKKFANGTYFCELKAGDKILPVRKMVLLK
ncbi:MAG: T9SS type A sorting domain-containing protein [bacterium]|nr:T9SS type A sorting domain-containing protein [bacterium]